MKCDLAIVGGGLAGGLVAYALSVKRPEIAVRLIEPGARFGGNHVWSFFSADIAPDHRWIVAPFVDHAWDWYEVRFPKYRRTFDTGYSSIRSENFDAKLHAALGPQVPLDGTAVDVQPTHVTLDTQAVLTAGGVIDARGAADGAHLDVGWQKFLGQELRLATPHGLTAPIIMDASVPQKDGFRFVYSLPFAPDRVFVEDTYYSADATLDAQALRDRIAAYVAAQGWQIADVISEEQGALPVAMGGDFDAYWASGGAAGKIGMRAGMFQAATGYSLPAAVRTAARLCALPDLRGETLTRELHALAKAEWAGQSYYRMLNRMAFRAAGPDERYRIYQRFYTLRAGLVERFYAGKSTAFDRFRILAGKPPVPIGRAIKVLVEGNR